MRDADDAIVLTDREREALAGLAQSIGDPWLARQLAGHEDPPPAPKKRRPAWRRPAILGPAAPWVSVLLILAGAAVAVTTFVVSTALGSLGLIVMGAGLWRLVVDQGDGIIRRLSSARRTPASPPSPPHTRPGAA